MKLREKRESERARKIYEEEKIAPLFLKSDMLLSPGNVGLNCIHSLAYGVPVLTHNDFKYQNPEVEAIEDGVTGVFFKRGDFDDMIEKLKEYMLKNRTKEQTVENCQKVIRDIYNPVFQSKCMIKGIDYALNG